MFLTRARLCFGASLLLAAVALEGCSLSPQLGKPDDRAIVSSIDASLFQDAVLKRRDIRVESQRGVVTLQGSVDTDWEKGSSGPYCKAASRCQKSGKPAGGNSSQACAPKKADQASANGSRRRPGIRAYIPAGTACPTVA